MNNSCSYFSDESLKVPYLIFKVINTRNTTKLASTFPALLREGRLEQSATTLTQLNNASSLKTLTSVHVPKNIDGSENHSTVSYVIIEIEAQHRHYSMHYAHAHLLVAMPKLGNK